MAVSNPEVAPSEHYTLQRGRTRLVHSVTNDQFNVAQEKGNARREVVPKVIEADEPTAAARKTD